MKKRTQTYDTPMLAMIKALNAHVGEEITLGELRDDWYFHLAHKDENRFVYWLDKTMEVVNDQVQVIYKLNPGWYTEVKFAVTERIEVGGSGLL